MKSLIIQCQGYQDGELNLQALSSQPNLKHLTKSDGVWDLRLERIQWLNEQRVVNIYNTKLRISRRTQNSIHKVCSAADLRAVYRRVDLPIGPSLAEGRYVTMRSARLCRSFPLGDNACQRTSILSSSCFLLSKINANLHSTREIPFNDSNIIHFHWSLTGPPVPWYKLTALQIQAQRIIAWRMFQALRQVPQRYHPDLLGSSIYWSVYRTALLWMMA